MYTVEKGKTTLFIKNIWMIEISVWKVKGKDLINESESVECDEKELIIDATTKCKVR